MFQYNFFTRIFVTILLVVRILRINAQPWMLIIAYINQIAVSVVLHNYMLLNKQFHKNLLYSMTSVVVLFSYPITLNISARNGITKILPKKLYCHLNRSSQCESTKCKIYSFINTLRFLAPFQCAVFHSCLAAAGEAIICIDKA